MRFKYSLLSIVLISSSILGLAGCGGYLEGQKTTQQEIKLSDDRFTCLKDMPGVLKKFSVGDATAAELNSTYDCTQTALLYFRKRTTGSVTDGYTTDDMRAFFGKYFLKENKVSPEFGAELMKVKQALLGGSDQYITKDEITQLLTYLAVVRDEAIRLTPQVRVLLTQAGKSQTDWDKVSTATEQFRSSLQNLLKNSQIYKSNYTFDDGKELLSGFADFIAGEQTYAPYEKYRTWIPIIEGIKNLLLGKDANLVGLTEWSEGLNTVIDLYSLALRYNYNISGLKFDNPQNLRLLSQFSEQTYLLIENSLQMQKTGQIPFTDIDYLIEQVIAKEKWSVRASSVEEIYRTAVLKVLDPDRKGDSRGLVSLTLNHMAALKREFNIWRLSQAFIDHIDWAKNNNQISQPNLLAEYAKFDYNYAIQHGLEKDSLEQQAMVNAWNDFGVLLKAPYLVNFNTEGRLIEDYNHSQDSLTWQSLMKYNLMKTLGRLMMVAYGENTAGELSQSYILKDQLVQWYTDFTDIGIDLKAFDPRTGNSGARSFMEANFFTFSGNGDDRMDIHETFEYISVLFSAGLGTSSSVTKAAATDKCDVPQLDVFAYNMMSESCFKQSLLKNFPTLFDNLPGMVSYVKSLSPADWNNFYTLLIGAARISDPSKGLVETADIRTMVTLLHYAECFMTIYNTDKTGNMNVSQVQGAAPRFMSFFKAESKVTNQTLLNEGFTYLVFEGHIPTAMDLVGFQWDKLTGLPPANRASLLRVLKTLKDELNKQTK